MRGKTNLKTYLVMSVILLGFGCTIAAGEVIYVDADASLGGDGSSWGTAYKYLQDAIYKPPASGDEIWVAEGTYKPDQGGGQTPNDRTATFQLLTGVAIYGGFAGTESSLDERNVKLYETILSGDLDGNDVQVSDPCDLLTEPTRGENSYNVVTGSGTDANAVLDGFTITAGSANGSYPHSVGGGMHNDSGSPMVTNCTFSANQAVLGGGMFNYNYSDPNLTNCTFSGNSASDGGGMWNANCTPTLTKSTFSDNSATDRGGGMFNNSGSPTLSNCTFNGNRAARGGGMYNTNLSSPTLTNCIFSGNLADAGGGMHNYNSNPTLTNCTFSGNTAWEKGGGMYNYNHSSPKLLNCTFIGNEAAVLNFNTEGGGMYNCAYGSPTLTNCIFSGNLADAGGGMYNFDRCSPTLTNCTFSGNSAGFGGGMVFRCYGNPIVTNCILGGDSWGEIIVQPGPGDEWPVLTLTYSDVQGEYWPGPGNIYADPLFVDADGPDDIYGTEDDNLRLLADSPCIDGGDNTAVPTDTTDLDGDGNTVEPTPWDLDGRDRFVDGDCDDVNTVDMGAYEFNYAYIGDFDYDCGVDFLDYAIFALAWLTEHGDGGWNPDCDISIPADNSIDWRDLDILSNNWLAGL